MPSSVIVGCSADGRRGPDRRRCPGGPAHRPSSGRLASAAFRSISCWTVGACRACSIQERVPSSCPPRSRRPGSPGSRSGSPPWTPAGKVLIHVPGPGWRRGRRRGRPSLPGRSSRVRKGAIRGSLGSWGGCRRSPAPVLFEGSVVSGRTRQGPVRRKPCSDRMRELGEGGGDAKCDASLRSGRAVTPGSHTRRVECSTTKKR
jgi:hypothetical protein